MCTPVSTASTPVAMCRTGDIARPLPPPEPAAWPPSRLRSSWRSKEAEPSAGLRPDQWLPRPETAWSHYVGNLLQSLHFPYPEFRRLTYEEPDCGCFICSRANSDTRPPSRLPAQESSEGVRKVVTKVIPQYPSLARSMNLQGVVRADVSVSPNGTVKFIEVKGGHPVLVDAAEHALRGWKWEPFDSRNPRKC